MQKLMPLLPSYCVGGDTLQYQFLTIHQTAMQEGIPETALRRMLREKHLPGFYSGTRFYVNVTMLREQLKMPPVD